tara:strand:- start:8987 stop:9124 length:138 start_codon:yes stop_codon:yes gene_type:complete
MGTILVRAVINLYINATVDINLFLQQIPMGLYEFRNIPKDAKALG